MGAGMAISEAISLLLALVNNASAISQLIAQAQAAGQTTLPADAWDTILANDTAAGAALSTAIANALKKPPAPPGAPPPNVSAGG